MQFRRAFLNRLSGDAQGIFNIMGIGVGLPRRAEEAAELAIDVADVRRVEMTVDVKVCRASMLPSAHRVSEFAQGVEIIGVKECDAVLEREAFAGPDLGADVVQFGVV